MYLMWCDDSAKIDDSTKVVNACTAYTRRFGTPPNVVLVNPSRPTPVGPDGVSVRADFYVPVNTFWVGREEVIQ